MQKTRDEIDLEDRWNVDAIYHGLGEWEKAFNHFVEGSSEGTWPQVQALKGTLGQGSAQLKKALETIFSISRELSKLYTYAHLRNDEDIAKDEAKSAFQRVLSLYHDFNSCIAWFDPELLNLPEAAQKAYLNDHHLKEYKFYLEQVFRLKDHTLSADKEELLALSGKALQATHKAFSSLNDADFVFGEVVDSKGKNHTLTHATYGLYLISQDRTLRKNSFLRMHGKYKDHANTMADLLNGTVQAHLFQVKAKKYPSCLDAALFPKNVDTSVYHSLIKAVRENISTFHKYIALRKRVLLLDKVHLYDISVPLCKDVEIKIPYGEAEEHVIASVAPLGSEYQNILHNGLKSQRWVDRYENKNKRSGAYSSGCYDSCPYILMNYKDILRDVFTLAHEAGHSMHSYYSNKNQPYHYADYSIFVAEVASTFNEQLLSKHLLEVFKKPEEKIYLINEKIRDIYGTLIRQTMFAEFELFLHESAEKNIPLTPAHLKEKYKELNTFYFGPDAAFEEEAFYEWARIPHFYYNFYVYQYATGISAAIALYKRVMEGSQRERDDYLGFLKSGGSAFPIDILAKAGVDMRKPQPVSSAIEYFGSLIEQLEGLMVGAPTN